MDVKTKKQNYALYFSGFYGNQPMMWNSAEEIIKSGWKADVCIRSTRGMDRGKVRYNVPLDTLDKVLREYEADNIPRSALTFNQAMPDANLAIQGEVMRSHEGLHLLFSRVKKPMNLALKEHSETAMNSKAIAILQHFLWPQSYDELMTLLDYFSGESNNTSSVVEFSAYDIAVGNKPCRNAVLWEVRNY